MKNQEQKIKELMEALDKAVRVYYAAKNHKNYMKMQNAENKLNKAVVKAVESK